MRFFVACSMVAVMAISVAFPALAQVENTGPTGYTPPVADASDEGEKAAQRVQKPEDMNVELFAAEPMLANPVAFYVDHQGDFYVAETFRHHAGVSDMRGHQSWLVDDLAARSVEERLIAMEKNLGDDFASYWTEHDRVRKIMDTDGDGKADKATIFADDFSHALAGIGAGLLVDRGNVYYTCIPELWLLKDEDKDGHADVQEELHYGYGVHINFLGHDLHGLRKGPDGRIYFSIGDRGFVVETKEGTVLDYPDTGAVLRCFPDGTGLEVVHYGLRNPQELAFDDHGNLFTGDNNSDGGDQARWVYIVDGGDSGWTIGWQWITEPNLRGPWNAEKMWHPYHEGQPAHIVPPIMNLGAGPSGLTYYPGTGMPDRYKNSFFMCDFRGNPVGSVIHSFQVKPKGASFEVVNREDFAGQILATDCDFGMDGGLYFTDWVAGWDKTKKGRIFRVFDPTLEGDAAIADTKKLLAAGFADLSKGRLMELLEHVDMRVRSEAQYALADHGKDALTALRTAARSGQLIPRLHGLWGMWQLMLAKEIDGSELVPYLSDKEPEIRAQAARILAEAAAGTGQFELVAALTDREPRVRFFAAIALGKQGIQNKTITDALVTLLRDTGDSDRYVRHAGVMGLVGCATEAQLADFSENASKDIRLAGLLALRRLQSPQAARYLSDDDAFIVTEAARAIHDGPIFDALPALASLADDNKLDWSNTALARRVLNAHYRLGNPENGRAVTRIALNGELPEALRLEALNDLATWNDPPQLDRVNGMWRPLPLRNASLPKTELTRAVSDFMKAGPEKVRVAAATLARTQGLTDADDVLLDAVRDTDLNKNERIAALQSLAALKTDAFEKGIQAALATSDSLVRLEGIAQLAKLNPKAAVPMLKRSIDDGKIAEQQAAFSSLGTINGDEAGAVLLDWVDRLASGNAPAPIQADIIAAAGNSPIANVREMLQIYQSSFTDEESLDRYRPALAGGDVNRGRKTFLEKMETQCLRCHKMGRQEGSEVGPDLTNIGSQVTREYILESIVFPNNAIAEGFENVIIELEDGETYSGRVIEDKRDTLVLELGASEASRLQSTANPHSIVDVIAEGSGEARTQVAFPKSNITDRFHDLSSMPEDMTEFLSLTEIRDLVEFLASRK